MGRGGRAYESGDGLECRMLTSSYWSQGCCSSRMVARVSDGHVIRRISLMSEDMVFSYSAFVEHYLHPHSFNTVLRTIPGKQQAANVALFDRCRNKRLCVFEPSQSCFDPDQRLLVSIGVTLLGDYNLLPSPERKRTNLARFIAHMENSTMEQASAPVRVNEVAQKRSRGWRWG